ncbi:hypothetical protein FHS89_001555 [Rubricella aquisinus]|uniref:DUF3572 family protein n=1 Tax=Rubricella aquisinus TaxID=2028108 RepID=A0A840WN68_9RHOB|nr:DUF3572 domain-containing protein [Rubricella aquisinus]MBB5515543.1 hypothetical protein [Rubricella aquisinus]
MNQSSAETLAITALSWMAADEDRLMPFMAQTGVGIDDLRNAMEQPEILGFILDFLLQDEAALIAFCDDKGLDYMKPAQARAALPGGQIQHWT